MTATTPGELIARGLAVFPMPAGAKVAPAGWSHVATTDPEAVASWPVGGNVGVACRPSGVVALDIDYKNGANGFETLRGLCADAGRKWPHTFSVATPHGLHLYFLAPDDVVVPSLIARWPGIDVRAPGRRIGGYLVGPGSVVDGKPYTISQDRPIEPLPEWIAAELVGWKRHRCSAARPATPGSDLRQ